MAWSERQHTLMKAMGLRLWSAPALDDALACMPMSAAVHAPLPTPAPALPPARPPARLPAPLPAPALVAREPTPPQIFVPTQPSPVATLDWPALRQAVADCRACTLCQGRTQTVFGVGHPQAHWLVVGEAPGAEEDERGEPFVGASGQLLDRMLAALRLTRSADGDAANERRVYIANTIKCRPLGNRNPQPSELAQCEPFLVRQIQLLQPRIILAMGRFAVQALLRSDEAIGKLRGRVHRYQGVPLVVTYHPAYLLRSLQDKAKAWEDLCLAADVAEQAEPVRQPA